MKENKDYKNFVERMGSFEDSFNDLFEGLDDTELTHKEELSHHGILGMKWGVRRTEAQLGRARKTSDEGSEDYQTSRALQKRGPNSLSTKELKDLTTRMQLEQQYKNLNPSQYKKGMDTVKKITAAGTTVASLYALSRTPLGQDVTKAVKAAINDASWKRAYRLAMGG